MEEFILKVKNYPCLWDTNSLFFRDVTRKTAAWEAVAQECGLSSVNQVKGIWKRLRDSHREAMRRRKISQVLAPWKYEEVMEFLLPQSSVEDHIENDEVSASEEDEKNTDHETQDSRNLPVYVSVRKREGSQDSSDAKRLKENERSERKHTASDRKRRASDEAVKELFSGLCQKTILLPKHLQLRVQREVFDAVLRAEEEALLYEGSGYERNGLEISRIEEAASSETVTVKKERRDKIDNVV